MQPETRVRAAALALLVALTGCGSGNDEGLPPELPTTAAAILRVRLDVLFREHVYLLGLATENAVTAQVKALEGATEALEENTLALADVFEDAYGDRAEKGFLAAWRPLSGLITTYAIRKARELKLGNVDKALSQAAGRVALFAGDLTPLIGAGVVAARMRNLMGSLAAAADAQVAEDYGKAHASLRTASVHAGDLASTFARAFADDRPVSFPGDTSNPSAGLRASLSATLVEHVYFLGATTENILAGHSRARDGAKAALDAASAALAQLIGASYGNEAEKAFGPLWKRQVDLLISYAGSIKDKAKREMVRKDLERYATDAAGFLAGLSDDLAVSPVESIVRAHSHAMTQVIDAQAAGDFKKAYLRLRAAAAQIEELGMALAVATIRSFPARYRSTPAGLPF